MGATTFSTRAKGRDAKTAFDLAVREARYDYGNRGYTGTIAEKDSFVEIALPKDMEAEDYAQLLINKCDSRIDDKWGPAGCIRIADDEYFFFGWASE